MWEILFGITLFGSFVWMAIFTGIFVLICFLSDIYENGFYAFFSFIVFVLLFYFWGSHDFQTILSYVTWISVGGYFGIGMVHAFIRSFFYGRNEGKRYLKELERYRKDKEINPDGYNRKPDPIKRNIKAHVFRWWFLWPVSLLVWIFKDIIREIYDFLYYIFSKLFTVFMNVGINTVNVKEIKDRTD